MSRGRAPDLPDEWNMGSRFRSGKSSWQFGTKFRNEKVLSQKRPNESIAGKSEPIPKKRSSGSDAYMNSSSSTHSWDAILQKRSNNIHEGKHKPKEKEKGDNDECKDMAMNRCSASDDPWNSCLQKETDAGMKKGSHSSWPAWNSCLQKETDAGMKKGSHSSWPAWNSSLQKETNFADEGNNNTHERKSSASDDCWNAHSSWPSWNSWLQNDSKADEGKDVPDKTSSHHWNSWLQKRSGAEHSKDVFPKRDSRSGDRVGSHYHKPLWKSRLTKRSNFEEDQTSVHGGRNSSNRDARWVSPGSRSWANSNARESNGIPWKSSNSSGHLQASSRRHAWGSEFHIRNNAEGLKSTLEESTSKVIKSLKKKGFMTEGCSNKERPHKRLQNSADIAGQLSKWPKWEDTSHKGSYKGYCTDSPNKSSIWDGSNEDAADMKPEKLMPNTTQHSGSPLRGASWKLKKRSDVENSISGSAEIVDTKPCHLESLQERGNSYDKAKDVLLQGNDSITTDESRSDLPCQSSDVQKINDREEVTNSCGKEADNSFDLPSRNLEGQGLKVVEDSRDVHNKGVNVGVDSFPSLISFREERNNPEKGKNRLEEVAFDKNDGERLSLGSSESNTRIDSNEGSKDGLLEVYTSSWPTWKCNEQRQSNLTNGSDASAERAINIVDAAELPSSRTSEVEMVHRGKEQVKDGLGKNLLHRTESTELDSTNQVPDNDGLTCTKDFNASRLQNLVGDSADGTKLPYNEPVLELGVESTLLLGDTDSTTLPPNKPYLESEVYENNKEHARDNVVGTAEVPIDQSSIKVPEMEVVCCSKDFGGSRLENLVGDSAFSLSPCTKYPNPPTSSYSMSVLPKLSVCGETYDNHLNVLHSISVCDQSCPAKKCIWKGSFEVIDIASVVKIFEGFTAHPSSKVCRKAYEFSKKMSSTLEFLVHPRSKYWPMIFEDCPDTNDIALYFYPKNDQALCSYASLLKFIDSKDLMLRSKMGHVELLVFPSRWLNVKCQTIKNSYFFWGVFHIKTRK
ncbi:unnamed protein product [Cuscuta europaea]|uniref:AIPP2-like SPOC-like domain-containing protein n=1 Tax=Cuscuta europaea TaxID=41803 RepID=A0A9P1E689_CUSEU|nr:unnamed protein product [Cuscuta europaea]